MNQIRLRDLQATVDRINRTTGNPIQPYIKSEDGSRLVAQIGNYHLDGAYGGHALHRMQTDGGGISDVFRSGHMTKRDLYNRMHAFLAALETKDAVLK